MLVSSSIPDRSSCQAFDFTSPVSANVNQVFRPLPLPVGRQFARKIRAGLFAVELRILRCDDLPSTIPLEPSIGPNQASGFVGSVFCLSD